MAHTYNPRIQETAAKDRTISVGGFRASLVYTVNSKTAWLQSEILSQIIHGASVVFSKHNCTHSHSCCSRLLCARLAESSHCHRDHMTWEVSTPPLWSSA